MIAKKNPKADLEKNRFAFFQIGLIVAGSLCLAAFEYSSVQKEPVAHYEIDPIMDGPLPFDDIVLEPSEPQQQKQRIMTEDVIVTEKKVADPVPDPDPIVDPEKKIVFDPEPKRVGPTTGIIAPSIIYNIPEIEPSFPGGQAGMAEFINKYIVIPNHLVDNQGGTIYVEFVVNKDGSIEQTKVVKSVSDALDKAALDVIARMPNWTPGEQGGKSVRSRLTIPINIKLR